MEQSAWTTYGSMPSEAGTPPKAWPDDAKRPTSRRSILSRFWTSQDDDGEAPDPPSWDEFTQNTTFHGIRFIFDPKPFPCRRLLWLVVVLVSVSLFLVQVGYRTQYYFEYHTTVDVGVIYNESLVFPTVTICNQNNFRQTVAVDRDLYGFIDRIYSSSHISVNMTATTETHVNKVNLDDFILESAHQLEDFIESCTWHGIKCSLDDDFVTMVTDLGVCYTFNSGQHKSLITVTEAGAASGLSLILNVEQYEYMRGPQNDAGVKMLLHDSNEVPQMNDMGFAAAPGTHTLVGVVQEKKIGMEDPYGTCIEDAIPTANCLLVCKTNYIVDQCGCKDVYMLNISDNPSITCNMSTKFTCVEKNIDKLQKERNRCNNCPVPCKRVRYEPQLSYAHLSKFNIDRLVLTDPTRKQEVLGRFRDAREVSQRIITDIADQDKAIMGALLGTSDRLLELLNSSTESIETFDSYVKIHNLPDLQGDVFHPQHDKEWKFLSSRITSITEMTSRLPCYQHPLEQEYKYNLALLARLLDKEDGEYYQQIQQLQDCVSTDESDAAIRECAGNFQDRTGNYRWCGNYYDYRYRHGNIATFEFTDPHGGSSSGYGSDDDLPECEYVNYQSPYHNPRSYDTYAPTGAFYATFTDSSEFTSSNDDGFEDYCSFMADINSCEHLIGRTMCYASKVNIDCLEQLLNDTKEVYIAAVEKLYGTKENLYDHDNQVQHQLCMERLAIMDQKGNNEWIQMMDFVQSFNKSELNVENVLNVSIELKNVHLKLEQVTQPESQGYLHTCLWPRMVGDHIDSNWDEILDELGKIRNSLQSLSGNFAVVATSFTSLRLQHVTRFWTYMENLRKYLAQNITKIVLAEELESVRFQNALSDLTELFDVFNSKVQSYIATANRATNAIHRVFSIAVKEYPIITAFNYRNDPFFSEVLSKEAPGVMKLVNEIEADPPTSLMAIVGLSLSGYTKPLIQLLTSISDTVEELPKAISELQSSLKVYKEGSQMNEQFYMENILQVDIFYRELSYHQVEQQAAFVFISLLSEVGGFLGLLLGASVLTMCEVADYLFLQASRICHRRNAVKQYSKQRDEK